MKLLGFALAIMFSPLVWGQGSPLVLKDSDRVVFVGSELVEVDAQYGYFETMLQARFPKAHFTFRNLGWSGDTVWGDARSEFGTQQEGYQKLVDEVTSAKPTVLLIAYGMNESFAGQAGLPHFMQQYDKLLSDLSKIGARIWLIGPNPHEHLGPPLPDPAEHNAELTTYNDAIAQLAVDHRDNFIDLLKFMKLSAAAPHLTTDGIHFTARGYWSLGQILTAHLTNTLGYARQHRPEQLAVLESLRQLINHKNREFFYRWRPQNDTYIFGFRKSEQGRNAVEIPQFDPIVQKLEQQIDEAKQALPWPGDWEINPPAK
jgi:lysophospholipase L1-like esterase